MVPLEQNQSKLTAFVSYNLGLTENRLKYIQVDDEYGNSFLEESPRETSNNATDFAFTASYNIYYLLFYLFIFFYFIIFFFHRTAFCNPGVCSSRRSSGIFKEKQRRNRRLLQLEKRRSSTENTKTTTLQIRF